IRQWNNALVLPVYFAMALASGAVLFLALARLFSYDRSLYGLIAIVLVASALAVKLAYWLSIDREPPRHTMAEATGLGRETRVRQWETPHTAENFVMKEMGYRVARKHRTKLRGVAIAAFLLTLVALIAAQLASGGLATALSMLAVIAIALALAVER